MEEHLYGWATVYQEQAIEITGDPPLPWWQEALGAIWEVWVEWLLPAVLFGAGVAIWQTSLLWSLGAFK
jgi:hypothetical protein